MVSEPGVPIEKNAVMEEARLRYLVVDSGALIRLEQLHSLADEFYTIREVLQEVRDAKARDALRILPFELKVKEPSPEAIEAVVKFAKLTGDISVLSKPDIKVMALTYMLHKELHGVNDLRTEPLKPGAPSEDPNHDDEEDDVDDDDDLHSQSEGEEMGGEVSTASSTAETPSKTSSVRWTVQQGGSMPIQSSSIQKPGVSWAAALGKNTTAVENTTTPSAIETSGNSTDLAVENMWDDDDFAAVDAPSALETEDAMENPLGEDAFPSLSSAISGPARDSWMKTRAEIESDVRENERIVHEKIEKLEHRRQKKEAKAAKERAATEVPESATTLEDTTNCAIPMTQSRILSGNAGYVDSGVTEEDDDEDSWITNSNIDLVDTQAALRRLGLHDHKKADAPKLKTNDFEVACVTTDYAMQNVMLQMQIRLVTLEGRAISTIRRFHLKCDSCKQICMKLDKIFCPSCGHNTLARLSYSITPDGILRYHYKKNRRVNLRGTKYCIPKPRGGRQGDLLLYEDQLLTGWWGQQARKKSGASCMFGEHVAESFGLSASGEAGSNVRVAYGRQNPNSAKGRERRGKKVKRNTKRPGVL